jgi:hypothetical protein
MPWHHGTHHAISLSSPIHSTSPCLGDVPNYPEHACTRPGRRRDLQGLERDVPRDAQTCQSAPGYTTGTPVHDIAPLTPSSPCPHFLHRASSHHPLPPRHAQSHRRGLSPSSSLPSFRHGTASSHHSPGRVSPPFSVPSRPPCSP